jgi:hypothetical protein
LFCAVIRFDDDGRIVREEHRFNRDGPPGRMCHFPGLAAPLMASCVPVRVRAACVLGQEKFCSVNKAYKTHRGGKETLGRRALYERIVAYAVASGHEGPDEMRQLQEQKNEALRMKLRGEVDAKTFREVTAEIDAAHDQLAREHNRLASEAAMPELPDPSLAWEDLSAEDRRALTEMLVDKIIVAPHPHKIVDGRRHYLIRAIPYQEPQQEAERLTAVHEARVKIVPRV